MANTSSKKPYIAPTTKVSPKNPIQTEIQFGKNPQVEPVTPKLNYNAESNIGKVPQAKVIQYVQPKQPSVKTISWEEAVKQQKKAVKQKKTAQTATKPLTKKSKPSNNKVRTPKPKVAKHYLGGVLTNNKFEKWISL